MLSGMLSSSDLGRINKLSTNKINNYNVANKVTNLVNFEFH